MPGTVNDVVILDDSVDSLYKLFDIKGKNIKFIQKTDFYE